MADDFDAVIGSGETSQQITEVLSGTLEARGHDAGGDHRGLQQAEVVLRVVEDLVEIGDVGRRAEVDAGEAEQRFVDHPEIRLDRWGRGESSRPRTPRSTETLSTRAASG